MIFTTTTVDTMATKSVTTDNIPLGNHICGLIRSGCRPQTVTLDADELRYLLQNERYGLDVMITLAKVERK